MRTQKSSSVSPAVALCAGVLSIAAVAIAWVAMGARTPAPATDTALREEVAALREEVAALRQLCRRLEHDLKTALEASRPAPAREPAALGLQASSGSPESAPVVAEPLPDAPPQAEPDEGRDLRRLLGPVLRGEVVGAASAEQQEAFWRAIKAPGALEQLMSELEQAVAATPNDPELRMQLADAYTARLTSANGPEQAVWGAKVEQQWQAVVDAHPDHWEAHQALASNYAYYPEFLGKGADVLRHLGECLRIQRTLPPEPRHVAVYRTLAQRYARAGKLGDAVAVLEEGVARHPGDTGLLADLDDVMQRLRADGGGGRE